MLLGENLPERCTRQAIESKLKKPVFRYVQQNQVYNNDIDNSKICKIYKFVLDSKTSNI